MSDPCSVDESLDALVARAAALAERPGRTVLGIVGPPGAGKSTASAAIAEALGERVSIVGMDGFHLDDAILNELGRRDRKGAPDTFDVGGYVALLQRLRKADEPVVYAPVFDRSMELSRGSAQGVPCEVPLVVTEGNYLLHDSDGWSAVRPLLDEVWYLDVDPAERQERLVRRRLGHGDDESSARAWVMGVDEPNAVVVARGWDRADLCVRLG